MTAQTLVWTIQTSAVTPIGPTMKTPAPSCIHHTPCWQRLYITSTTRSTGGQFASSIRRKTARKFFPPFLCTFFPSSVQLPRRPTITSSTCPEKQTSGQALNTHADCLSGDKQISGQALTHMQTVCPGTNRSEVRLQHTCRLSVRGQTDLRSDFNTHADCLSGSNRSQVRL